jgi:hypothetical protein
MKNFNEAITNSLSQLTEVPFTLYQLWQHLAEAGRWQEGA